MNSIKFNALILCLSIRTSSCKLSWEEDQVNTHPETWERPTLRPILRSVPKCGCSYVWSSINTQTECWKNVNDKPINCLILYNSYKHKCLKFIVAMKGWWENKRGYWRVCRIDRILPVDNLCPFRGGQIFSSSRFAMDCW